MKFSQGRAPGISRHGGRVRPLRLRPRRDRHGAGAQAREAEDEALGTAEKAY